MEALLEQIKGAWSILAIVIAAIFTWLGWVIKAKLDNRQKKSEADLLASARQDELNKKLDRVIALEVESSSVTNKKLDRIAEGLDMALDCNEVIFESFHKSKLMNGESEAQRLKLREFRKKLAKEALFNPPEDFNEAEELSSLLKREG